MTVPGIKQKLSEISTYIHQVALVIRALIGVKRKLRHNLRGLLNYRTIKLRVFYQMRVKDWSEASGRWGRGQVCHPLTPGYANVPNSANITSGQSLPSSPLWESKAETRDLNMRA